MSDEPDKTQPGEDRLAELLDRYLEALQGDRADDARFVEEHPELAGFVECLSALDRLAPQAPVASQRDDGEDELERSVGNYELLRELGRGGMGVVYEARQAGLDRKVALKMILSHHFASPDDVRRFQREARAAGKIRHRNVVAIHEVGEWRGQHYFAMDLVEGKSLAEILKDGPLEPERAAEIVAAIARAVGYLHSKGIVHRDLKPSNILIDEDGAPLVTDFGLAKIVSDGETQTMSGLVAGTPGYMAPEQATGQPEKVGTASDIYGLGAVLYAMVTGRPPFQRETPLDTLIDTIEGEPTLPSRLGRTVPRELELICMRCLEKEPKQRYQSAEQLAHELEQFLKGEPVEAQSTGLSARLRRWWRREPALVSRLAGLLSAAAIVQIRYMIDPSAGATWQHVQVMTVFALWALTSAVFQHMLNVSANVQLWRFAWSFMDVVWLTWLLLLADGPVGPLLVGYPLLIAAAGMFFQVRLVTFMTVCCVGSFAVVEFARAERSALPHYPLIFAFALLVLGAIVAYQVYRVRVLSRYFESRRFQ